MSLDDPSTWDEIIELLGLDKKSIKILGLDQKSRTIRRRWSSQYKRVMQEGQFDVLMQAVVETTDVNTTSIESLAAEVEAAITAAVEQVGGTATTDDAEVDAAVDDLGVTVPDAPAPTEREFFLFVFDLCRIFWEI